MKPIIEQSFDELKRKGADCPADLTHDVLLIELRHMFLTSAKEMVASNDEGERIFAEILSECVESLQTPIEILGSEYSVEDFYG